MLSLIHLYIVMASFLERWSIWSEVLPVVLVVVNVVFLLKLGIYFLEIAVLNALLKRSFCCWVWSLYVVWLILEHVVYDVMELDRLLIF